MTAERRARQPEAESHPNAADLTAARLHCSAACNARHGSSAVSPLLCHRHYAHAEPLGNNSAL